jgi:hypothetical protein
MNKKSQKTPTGLTWPTRPDDPLLVDCPVCHRLAGQICKKWDGTGRWGNPHKKRKQIAKALAKQSQ